LQGKENCIFFTRKQKAACSGGSSPGPRQRFLQKSFGSPKEP